MPRLQQEERPNKIKGTAWLLSQDKSKPAGEENQRKKIIEQHLKSQNKKWKKITNNRFEGYSRKIEQLVQSSFKKQNENFSEFAYESMRQTQSQMGKSLNESSNGNFKVKRREYETQIFQLKRKEKDIQNQIVKMDKLKEVTDICEQKRNFYDGCVDKYFEDYRKDINKTITHLADKVQRASKASLPMK